MWCCMLSQNLTVTRTTWAYRSSSDPILTDIKRWRGTLLYLTTLISLTVIGLEQVLIQAVTTVRLPWGFQWQYQRPSHNTYNEVCVFFFFFQPSLHFQMLLLFTLIYLSHNVIQAAPSPLILPLAGSSSNQTSPTHSCVDQQRSIWDILWSCSATIFACTWVSVHPNIPGRDNSQWKIFSNRAQIMLWTIMAPELVILWALREWFAVWEIAKKCSCAQHHSIYHSKRFFKT